MMVAKILKCFLFIEGSCGRWKTSEIHWLKVLKVEGWNIQATIWCQDGSYPSVGISWLPHSLHLDQILQGWNNMRLREIKHCRLATSPSLKQWGMWFACGYFGTGEVRTCLLFFVLPFCACMHSSALWSLVPLATNTFFIAGMSNLNQDCALALVNIPLENWLKSRALTPAVSLSRSAHSMAFAQPWGHGGFFLHGAHQRVHRWGKIFAIEVAPFQQQSCWSSVVWLRSIWGIQQWSTVQLSL